jgi:M penetrans paralogue family 26
MENQTNFNQQNINQQFQQQFSQPFGQQQLPNATAVLVLGIISIVGCFCYGIIGIVLGIIALVLSSKANKIYNENPGLYNEVSYKNMKAGRVCAIIGTCLSSLYLVIIIIYIVLIGAFISGMPWGMMGRH